MKLKGIFAKQPGRDARKRLLERRLTIRLIFLQMIIVPTLFLLGVFPVYIYPALTLLGDVRTLDIAIMGPFADMLTRDESGKLKLVLTPSFERLAAEYPDMWFAAQDEARETIVFGNVPPLYDWVRTDLYRVNSLEVNPRSDDEGITIGARAFRTKVGEVIVATGRGPMVDGAAQVRFASATVVVLILAALVVVSAVAVPFFVRRELRGLRATADEAEHLDIESRGSRLSEGMVPSEVLALVKAVNSTLARMDKLQAQRARFMATSAHELRTPIAILQTRIETAKPFPEQSRLLLDVSRLGSLAGQLLDLQRLEMGEATFEPIDLTELVNEVVADIAPLAIRRGCTISVEQGPVQVIVSGDYTSLFRAITNLTQNAIFHGKPHGQVWLQTNMDGSLSVNDDGQGIPVEERERIFEPFYRSKPSKHGGGLGLSLVETIIRIHGGHVTVEDSSAGGASFRVTLPFTQLQT